MQPLLVAVVIFLAGLRPVGAHGVPRTVPANGARGVLRFVQPGWFLDKPFAARVRLRLVTPIGTEVPGILKSAARAAVFEPATPLVGCTQYTLVRQGSDGSPPLQVRFRTACGPWGVPVEIDDARTAHLVDRPADGAQVADAGDGRVVAAWFQSDGDRDAILVSIYTPATDFWSLPQPIDVRGAGPASIPALATEGHARVIAAWVQAVRGRDAVFARRLHGERWSAAVRLDPPTSAGDATNPQIATDASAHAVAVWQQPDQGRTRIFAAGLPGVQWRWFPAFAVARSRDNAYAPVVASGGDGRFVAAWEQGPFGKEAVWATDLRASDRSARASRRISPAGVRATQPAIAGARRGHALLAWVQGRGSTARIAVAFLDASTLQASSARVMTASAFPGAALAPSLARDAAGNITLAWEQGDQRGRDGILVSRWDALHKRWSEPRRLDNPRWGSAGKPSLAVDPAGNVTCAWYQDGPEGIQVLAARFDPATARWTAPAELSDPRQTVQTGFPALAVDPGGSVTAVWQQRNSWRSIVMAARLP